MRWLAVLALFVQATAPTPDIHFVPTSSAVVDAMLKIAHVASNDVVYDLGSGDGRIVIAAAQKYGARAVGVELDPDLIKTATKRAAKAGVSDKVTFVRGDLFKADISPATVVMLYLSESTNFRLESKLQHELKPGTRVVSHRFPMRDWPADDQVSVEGTKVYLWNIR